MKIWIIEESNELGQKLQKKMSQWSGIHCEIESIIKLNCTPDPLDKIIVDASYFKEVNQLNNHKNQTIILLDYDNKSYNEQYLVSGHTVHYNNASISALIYKLFGVSQLFSENKTLMNSIQKAENNKVIALLSATGGVGKSALAQNMAIELVYKKKKVLLIDFSTISSVDINLNLPKKSNSFSNVISEIQNREIENDEDIKKIIKDNIHTKIMDSFKLDILYGITPVKMETVSTGEVELIINTVRKLDYDFIIIDTTCELSARNITLAELADHITLISTPDVSSGWKLIQFKEIIDYMQLSHKCHLILNKYISNVNFSCKDLENEIHAPLIGVLPMNKELIYYSNHGIAMAEKKTNKYNKYIRGIINQYVPIYHSNEINVKKI